MIIYINIHIVPLSARLDQLLGNLINYNQVQFNSILRNFKSQSKHLNHASIIHTKGVNLEYIYQIKYKIEFPD